MSDPLLDRIITEGLASRARRERQLTEHGKFTPLNREDLELIQSRPANDMDKTALLLDNLFLRHRLDLATDEVNGLLDKLNAIQREQIVKAPEPLEPPAAPVAVAPEVLQALVDKTTQTEQRMDELEANVRSLQGQDSEEK